ncbi:hypothetical protein Hanom_Chr05g00414291 [Helianthus anomalus]
MSTGTKPTTKKRKYKPTNPPGPDRAEINWKREEFQNLVRDLGFRNFRLPMTKFTWEVLTNYGLHISQINALGLPRITHFEFICRANRVEPTFEKFNVFYFVRYTGGFYSFNSRTNGVSPAAVTHQRVFMTGNRSFSTFNVGLSPLICNTGSRVRGSLVFSIQRPVVPWLLLPCLKGDLCGLTR